MINTNLQTVHVCAEEKRPKNCSHGKPSYNWSQSEMQLGTFAFWILYLSKLFFIDTALLSNFSALIFFRRISCEKTSRAFERSQVRSANNFVVNVLSFVFCDINGVRRQAKFAESTILCFQYLGFHDHALTVKNWQITS